MNDLFQEMTRLRLAGMVRDIENMVMGVGLYTEATAPQGPSLTYEKLKAVHDYLKPEKLTVAGEEMEIYGFSVHTTHCPEGITVLTEKDNPNDVIPKRGKLVIINENTNQALVYDPAKAAF